MNESINHGCPKWATFQKFQTGCRYEMVIAVYTCHHQDVSAFLGRPWRTISRGTNKKMDSCGQPLHSSVELR